jgi:outer membrane lipoprotein-sorting protein
MREQSIVPPGLLFLACVLVIGLCAEAKAQDAHQLVKEALDYYRGNASISLVEMTIHRPDWERTLTIKAWTKGIDYSLFFILAPAKDRGNGTLKKGRNMWMYNPKVNRVIKIPPSMMSQPWMGSDFSNNDVAKSDSILVDYTHSIVGTETHEGQQVYLIESTPKPAAPVVWGLQKVKIREDHILLSEEFYDEEQKLVKALTSRRMVMMGGKLFPKFWKMQKAGSRDYTLLEYKELAFKEDLPESRFSLSSLKNPPRR